jgi:hypothetical protein
MILEEFARILGFPGLLVLALSSSDMTRGHAVSWSEWMRGGRRRDRGPSYDLAQQFDQYDYPRPPPGAERCHPHVVVLITRGRWRRRDIAHRIAALGNSKAHQRRAQ